MNTFLVLLSAGQEWQAARSFYPGAAVQQGVYGEWFEQNIAGQRIILVHGGWGKIAAAASAEFSVSYWRPSGLINLGTCGGFMGRIETGEILLVDRTIVYDIFEQMNDPEVAIRRFSTELDLSWLQPPYPHPVRRGLLVSADRDILPADIPMLEARYGAIGGDWESGAIAWVAARHNLPCLILRGVSDLVGVDGGQAYGQPEVFRAGAERVTRFLLENLARWIEKMPGAVSTFGE